MATGVTARPVRVVVADDQDIVRDGLVTVLSLLDDIEVVAQARTGLEAVAAVRNHNPEVVLMDLRMPEMDGAAATAVIRREFPQVVVLVLTTYDDDASITRALTAGARGYLTKDASRHDIAAALRSVPGASQPSTPASPPGWWRPWPPRARSPKVLRRAATRRRAKPCRR
jgi:DNA-binding NarL/FixJ family response regulator